jgi:Uncharacterized anaerobic dehydrogenase
MIAPDRIVPTTCPYCGVGCKLELHIKDDYVYKVTSPFDAVVNHGNLCVKGRFGYDFIYNKDRVTTPLIRKTKQSPGARTQAFNRDEWREVSWDEALDYTADRMVEIYQRDGADAMAVYCCAKATNEDNYLLQKLFRALFRSNNIDHCTRLCHAGSVVALQMALGSSAMSNTAAEVIHSDVFLVTGSNTAETHPIIALQMKAAVEKHGAKLIVVDPGASRWSTGRRSGCPRSRAPTYPSSPPWRMSSSRNNSIIRTSSTGAPKASRTSASPSNHAPLNMPRQFPALTVI